MKDHYRLVQVEVLRCMFHIIAALKWQRVI